MCAYSVPGIGAFKGRELAISILEIYRCSKRVPFGFSRNFRAVWACIFTEDEEDTWIHILGAAPRVLSPVILDPARSTGPAPAARHRLFDHRGEPMSGRGGVPDLRINLSAYPQQVRPQAA